METWKPILGYEGLYEVSSYGRVKVLEKIITYPSGRKEKTKEIFKVTLTLPCGYVYVGLTKNRKHKMHRLHRLVAIAFIDNPKNLPQVNHKDYIKSNNIVDNLEWCDASYNQKHAQKKPGRVWSSHRKGMCGKLSVVSKPVCVLSLSGDFIAEYESMRLAAKATGSIQSKISLCCSGHRKSHNKLIFKYAK